MLARTNQQPCSVLTVRACSSLDTHCHARWYASHAAPAVAPWIEWWSAAQRSDMWQEKVLHMGLAGVLRFHYFNVWAQDVGGRPATTAVDDRLLSALLHELDEMVGCSPRDRQWVVDAAPRWSDQFVLTGMDAGADRRVWRLTAAPVLTSDGAAAVQLQTRTDPDTGVLSVGPLRYLTAADKTRAAEDCWVRFEWGQVVNGTAHAPAGLWVMQSLPPPPVTVKCGDSAEVPWPVGTGASVTL